MAGWYYGQADTLNSWWVQWDLRADLWKQVVRLNSPRLSFATGLSHLPPLLLSLLLKTNIIIIIIIITMIINSGTVTQFCTEYPWRQICNENFYAKKNDNHSSRPRQGPRMTWKKSASGLGNLTGYDPDTFIRHVAWVLPASLYN